VDLLVSTLGGMDCILGMEFITQNNVFIEGHNRLVKIPSKSGIVQVKAHKLPCVGTNHPLYVRKNMGKGMCGRLWHDVCYACVGRI
jgi:hypothetical protein